MKLPWPFARRIMFGRIPTTTAPLTTHIYKRGEKVAEDGPALVLYGRTPDGRHWHLSLADTGRLSPVGHVITAEAPDKSLPPFSKAAVLIDVDHKVIEDRRDAWLPNTRWNDTAEVTSFDVPTDDKNFVPGSTVILSSRKLSADEVERMKREWIDAQRGFPSKVPDV